MIKVNKKTAHKPGSSLAAKVLLTALIWGLGIVMVIPFVWMLSTSFKGMNEVFTFPIEWIPPSPTLKGYRALFSGSVSFFVYFLNSAKVAVIALFGTFFSCTLAGYAYAKINFFGRNKIFMMKLMTTMLPGMVTILPTYMIYSKLSLLNTHAALWIGSFCGGTFGVFLMRQAFLTIPDSLVDAAKVDGASHLRIYWSVALPNVKTSVSTLLFMYFLWTWNDYEKPLLYLWSNKLYTLPLAVKQFSDDQMQNYPAIMAANIFMLLPVMIFFISCQKFFVESLVSSGIKG
ncbi:MAG TPA: carbohydrate ABC transporter permease [Candidatus Aphodomonas merdavium]|nr:carbohydrate ABC transporter permease [Candidatus Aphodomonas merdavium]